MTDREMLELAAKAAGIFDLRFDNKGVAYRNVHIEWNPLESDGDALRLAVKLGLLCGFVQPNCWAELPGQYPSYEPCEPNPYAATRLAITRATAEIGKGME